MRSLTAITIFLMLCACGPHEISVTRHPASASEGKPPAGKVVFLAGPDSHGPLAHEHQAGSELLAAALQKRRPDFETINVYGGWPEDESVFNNVDSIVLYCDGGRKHLINKHLETFRQLLQDGVGVVALHYCVEVLKDSPSAIAMLDATGGYFETDWSVNPHWEANFASLPRHPITEGITPFEMNDEWYFNMRFQADMAGVTPILSAIAPAHTMERDNGPHSGNDTVRGLVANKVPQTVAWAYQRPAGGRGFGYTGGHFHANWQDDNARELVVNAILWTANQ